ncbi:uncharacterized protein AMSG_04722 [Thecamonas trahens ATCC 50062]|uniref:Uncharacterized protein n=1 Tax=Thecamonas trahens ATCC 50062 TaxID=461836 RepID=A0A0L0DCE3_THETB|nr:hypothetical protein AMSG_04722 [Thecamonas trahens ATCC 50062]KNC48978.1 hypothetical protein AMSG_04722 [Thecamonas trahens ATCC 50062]|eukprot:XP_013758393.1 hypothetical protein AMSG_04722 [Thecamonas trahens ATCC 50062]
MTRTSAMASLCCSSGATTRILYLSLFLCFLAVASDGASVTYASKFTRGDVMATGTCHPNALEVKLTIPAGYAILGSSFVLRVGYPDATALFNIDGECDLSPAGCNADTSSLVMENAVAAGTAVYTASGDIQTFATVAAPFMAPEFDSAGVPVLDPATGLDPANQQPREATFTVSVDPFTLVDLNSGATQQHAGFSEDVIINLRPMLAGMSVPIETDYSGSIAAGVGWLTPRDLVAWTSTNVMSEYFAIKDIEVLEFNVHDGTTPNTAGKLRAPDINGNSPIDITHPYDYSDVGNDANPATSGTSSTYRSVFGELQGCESAAIISYANVNELFTDTRLNTDPTLVTGDSITADSVWRGTIIGYNPNKLVAAAATGRPIKPKPITLEVVAVNSADCPCGTNNPVHIGDIVTYEMRYPLISTDYAALELTLNVPSPQHDVTGTTYSGPTPIATYPAPNVCTPAADSAATQIIGSPSLAVDSGASQLTFTFPPHSDMDSIYREIVIRCSYTVVDVTGTDLDTFSATDGALENSIFATSDADLIAVRQPLINFLGTGLLSASSSSVTATCSSCPASDWLDAMTVNFCDPASPSATTVAISPPITSPVAASVSGMDGSDIVRLSAAYKNVQSGIAHNVVLHLNLDTTCYVQRPGPCGLSLTVTDGAGSPLAYTLAAESDLFSTNSPGLIVHAVPGDGVAIIAFDVEIAATVESGTVCAAPTAPPMCYLGHFTSPVPSSCRLSPAATAAELTVAVPKLDTLDITTSFDYTNKASDRVTRDDLAPCETVVLTYTATFPEGISPDASFTLDSEAPGEFVIESVTVTSPALTWSGAAAVLSNSNSEASINLGTIVNTPDNIVTAADTMTFVATLRVDGGSMDAADLKSRFRTTARIVLSNGVNIRRRNWFDVVHPVLNVELGTSPTVIVDAGDAAVFNARITVPSSAHTDTLDGVVTLAVPDLFIADFSSATSSGSHTPISTTVVDGNLVVVLPQLAPGADLTISIPGSIPTTAPSGSTLTFTAARTFASTAGTTAAGCYHDYSPAPVIMNRVLASPVAALTLESGCLDALPTIVPSEALTYHMAITLPEGVNYNPTVYLGATGPLTLVSAVATLANGSPMTNVNLSPEAAAANAVTLPLFDSASPPAVTNPPDNIDTDGDIITIVVTAVVNPGASRGDVVTLLANYAYSPASVSATPVATEVNLARTVSAPLLTFSSFVEADASIAAGPHEAGDTATWELVLDHDASATNAAVTAHDVVYTVVTPPGLEIAAASCTQATDASPAPPVAVSAVVSPANVLTVSTDALGVLDSITCELSYVLPDSVEIGGVYPLAAVVAGTYQPRSSAPSAPACLPAYTPPSYAVNAGAAAAVTIKALPAGAIVVSPSCVGQGFTLAHELLSITLSVALPRGTLTASALDLIFDGAPFLFASPSAILDVNVANGAQGVPLSLPTSEVLSATLPLGEPNMVIVYGAADTSSSGTITVSFTAMAQSTVQFPLEAWPIRTDDITIDAALDYTTTTAQPAVTADFDAVVLEPAGPLLTLTAGSNIVADGLLGVAGDMVINLVIANAESDYPGVGADIVAQDLVLRVDLDTAGLLTLLPGSVSVSVDAAAILDLSVTSIAGSVEITLGASRTIALGEQMAVSFTLVDSSGNGCQTCSWPAISAQLSYRPGGACSSVDQGRALTAHSGPVLAPELPSTPVAGVASVGCYEYAVLEGNSVSASCGGLASTPLPLGCGWEVAPNNGSTYHAMHELLCGGGATPSCAFGASCLILADGSGITPDGTPCATDALVTTPNLVGACGAPTLVSTTASGGRVLIRRKSSACSTSCAAPIRDFNLINAGSPKLALGIELAAGVTLDTPSAWSAIAGAYDLQRSLPALKLGAGASLSFTVNILDLMVERHGGRLVIPFSTAVPESFSAAVSFDGGVPSVVTGSASTELNIAIPSGTSTLGVTLTLDSSVSGNVYIPGVALAPALVRAVAATNPDVCLDPDAEAFNW